ncbi:toxin [Trueperella pecoris]|nr:toxin [Trueperella pecoris]
MKLHASARKHQANQGLTDDGIILAAGLPLWVEPLDEENPQRELRLGFDDAGRLLETVVLIFDSGNELMIHAVKARPQYIALLP